MPRRVIASPRYREARKKRTVRLGVAWAAALVSVCAAVILFLDSPYTRIAVVQVSGGDPRTAEKVRTAVEATIGGDIWGFIPRDSTFFFPEGSLMKSLPREFPQIDSVAISRVGLTAARATIVLRTPTEIVCLDASDCYYADGAGVMFETASSTGSTLPVYNIVLPRGTMPEGVQFMDPGRLAALAEFTGGLARLGFAVYGIEVSTSTLGYVYGFDARDLSLDASSSATSSVMRLTIDESKPFAESLQDFSAFWQEHLIATATDTAARALSSVDMRFGDNIIYKTASTK